MTTPSNSLTETAPLLSPSSNNDGSLNADNNTNTDLKLKLASAAYSWFTLGLFVASIGVLLPHYEAYYNLDDIQVSLIFLVVPLGYVTAAQMNDLVHRRFGQRGVATLGPIFQLIATVIMSLHPPFPLLLIGHVVLAFGAGQLDGSFCSWAAGMPNANTVSGLLHGSFSLGAAIGPILAGSLISAGHRPWYTWYYVLAAASAFEVIALPIAFRRENATRYHSNKEAQQVISPGPTGVRQLLRNRAIWLCSAYFLAYVGTETAISGWVVSYMIRARNASPYLASISSSSYWLGQALGRLSLGFLTDRLGLALATALYYLLAIVLQILLAAIKQPVANIVFIALVGFWFGPVYPNGAILLTKSLPKEMHVSAMSFASSIAQMGGAVLPFVIGALIQKLGISAFGYVIIVTSAIALGFWTAFSLPSMTKRKSDEQQQDNEDSPPH